MKKGAKTASKNYYDLLQVSPRARPEVIHAAYRALLKSLGDDDADLVGRISEAYGVLSSETSRLRYDGEREAGGTIIGEYRVLEEIAEGGFGKTYKGEHVFLGEPVCIKQCSRISPDADAVLIEEAKAMWHLRHFGIPAARTVMRHDDGSLMLVMSFIPGPTLAQIVEKHGRLDAEHVAWISQRILNVLVYLHVHGVIHGDLKPQNVIVQPDTHTVVLVDFGLSSVKPTSGTKSKGFTDVFAPPEQLAGGTLIPESDIYSLGMTMLHMLCGGDLDRVKDLEVPSDVPGPLCRFIKRLVAENPLDRPKDAGELFADIQKVREESFGRSQSGMKPLPMV